MVPGRLEEIEDVQCMSPRISCSDGLDNECNGGVTHRRKGEKNGRGRHGEEERAKERGLANARG